MLKDFGLADAAMMPCSIDHEQAITFADLGRQDFALPRYDDIVDAIRELPDRTKPRCFSLKFSEDPGALHPPSVLPDGLIFHVGRCGSTLLCRLLDQLLGCMTIKEPEVLNRLLVQSMDPQGRFGRGDFEHYFLFILQSFAFAARRVRSSQGGCLVKLSSWNLLTLGDFMGKLDGVPKILLVRDPLATVASMVANPPDWYVSSRDGQKPVPADMVRLFATEWVEIVDAALRLRSPPLIIDYHSLVDDPWGTVCAIADHCSLLAAHSPPTAATIKNALQAYSKSREYERYDPEGRHRRQRLSSTQAAAVLEKTSEAWARVNELTTPASDKTGPTPGNRYLIGTGAAIALLNLSVPANRQAPSLNSARSITPRNSPFGLTAAWPTGCESN